MVSILCNQRALTDAVYTCVWILASHLLTYVTVSLLLKSLSLDFLNYKNVNNSATLRLISGVVSAPQGAGQMLGAYLQLLTWCN